MGPSDDEFYFASIYQRHYYYLPAISTYSQKHILQFVVEKKTITVGLLFHFEQVYLLSLLNQYLLKDLSKKFLDYHQHDGQSK